jgi:hypothetical protein
VNASPPPQETFSDLIYLENYADYQRCQAEILEAFPQAKFQDASDYIHEYRFEVTLPVSDEEAFFKLAIRKGFARCSLKVGLRMYGGDLDLMRLIEEVRAEQEGSSQ